MSFGINLKNKNKTNFFFKYFYLFFQNKTEIMIKEEIILRNFFEKKIHNFLFFCFKYIFNFIILFICTTKCDFKLI